MRLTCRGTLPDGAPCRQTLLEVVGAEVRVQHKRRRVVLRGLFVGGSIQCDHCGELLALIASDFADPASVDLPAVA